MQGFQSGLNQSIGTEVPQSPRETRLPGKAESTGPLRNKTFVPALYQCRHDLADNLTCYLTHPFSSLSQLLQLPTMDG